LTSSENGSESPKPANLKGGSVDDGGGFFGKVHDSDEIRKQLAKDFFNSGKDTPDAPVAEHRLVKNTKESTSNKSGTARPKSEATSEATPTPSTPSSGPEAVPKKFNCAKRALLLYKHTVRTISDR